MISPVAGCVICGKKRIERNHAGGRNFVAWFTLPFCPKHHTQFHALVDGAGINLEYTSDPIERLIRALKALLVCAFMLLEALQELNFRSTATDLTKVEEGINEHV
jgi:hypothetical protein